ncbi:SRPBCC family protein [Chitinophagaceae bacterium LWZ2-11]
MWTRTHSITTKEVTKEQLWKLFTNVNNWHTWDNAIEYAQMDGEFTKGNHFFLKPKGGPKVKISLLETIPNEKYIDCTHFPLAKMYDTHSFEETPEGLKFTNVITVKGPLSFLWIKLVAQKIVDGFQADMLNQIKTASKL